MRPYRGIAAGLAALTLMNGCTAMRELPRSEYASLPERRDVVVNTRDGKHVEFDSAHFGPDTLIGYHRREDETEFADYEGRPIPLDDVTKISAKRVDWRRTGALIALAVGAGIAVLVNQHSSKSTGGSSDPVKPPPD